MTFIRGENKLEKSKEYKKKCDEVLLQRNSKNNEREMSPLSKGDDIMAYLLSKMKK